MENEIEQISGFLRIGPMKRRRFFALFALLLLPPLSVIAQGTTGDYIKESMGFNLNLDELPDEWRKEPDDVKE